MSELNSLLAAARPELKPVMHLIGQSLAGNYLLGLNGHYAERLSEGVRRATATLAGWLPGLVDALIKERATLGGDAPRIKIAGVEDERLLRVLILALWNCRDAPCVGRSGRVEIGGHRVYGEQQFMPLSTGSGSAR